MLAKAPPDFFGLEGFDSRGSFDLSTLARDSINSSNKTRAGILSSGYLSFQRLRVSWPSRLTIQKTRMSPYPDVCCPGVARALTLARTVSTKLMRDSCVQLFNSGR